MRDEAQLTKIASKCDTLEQAMKIGRYAQNVYIWYEIICKFKIQPIDQITLVSNECNESDWLWEKILPSLISLIQIYNEQEVLDTFQTKSVPVWKYIFSTSKLSFGTMFEKCQQLNDLTLWMIFLDQNFIELTEKEVLLGIASNAQIIRVWIIIIDKLVKLGYTTEE